MPKKAVCDTRIAIERTEDRGKMLIIHAPQLPAPNHTASAWKTHGVPGAEQFPCTFIPYLIQGAELMVAIKANIKEGKTYYNITDAVPFTQNSMPSPAPNISQPVISSPAKYSTDDIRAFEKKDRLMARECALKVAGGIKSAQISAGIPSIDEIIRADEYVDWLYEKGPKASQEEPGMDSADEKPKEKAADVPF